MSSAMQEFTGGELVKLVTEKWIARVIVGFQEAIAFSFETDGLIRPVQTRNEIERRFKILIKWFVALRRDLHWSVPHILDELPKILRIELDGGKYDPNEDRSAWLGKGKAPSELEVDGGDLSDPVPIVEGIEAEGV